MNITLPESLKEWVNEQVEQGGYENVSEYLKQVLRREKRRRLRAQIEKSLIEALDSGPATPMTRVDWDTIRREGRKRAAASRKRK